MDLKQFVKEALVQITEGVQESQKTINISGGDPAPSVKSSSTFALSGSPETIESNDCVEFSVALHVDSRTPGGLLVVDDKLLDSNATAVRVQFQLPIDSVFLDGQTDFELETLATEALEKPQYNEVYLCY
ncbi:hypothetical protein [Vibrio sp. WXL103]|uniref:hypothetical protein n=1 Tax=Vibrio sp. WXL103 TaxID=3450710 RepID=UPI003EC50870